jgi:Predicted O-methyltransferase
MYNERSMDPINSAFAPWTRKHGPLADTGLLEGGHLIGEIPAWFVEFFLSTRDIGAIKPGESDSCTMTTVEDNWCLYRLVQMAAPTKSLEIGIMRGSSSITIARALSDSGLTCVQTAVDIDPAAATAAAKHFATYALHSRYVPVVADSREWIRTSSGSLAVRVSRRGSSLRHCRAGIRRAYNRLDVGGIIVLHDTGSVAWGTNEDPGVLFFGPLDSELGTSAEMSWLDATSCGTDMRLRTSMGFHSTLPTISSAIAVGWGGMGIVRKLDDRRTMTCERLLEFKPARRPLFFEAPAPSSPVRRVARRVASLLGV